MLSHATLFLSLDSLKHARDRMVFVKDLMEEDLKKESPDPNLKSLLLFAIDTYSEAIEELEENLNKVEEEMGIIK